MYNQAGPSQQVGMDELAVFQEFESYSFSDDPDFKAGLPTVIGAIRGTKRSAAEIDEMIGRAQWFYFTRLKGVMIPWESYAAYSHSSHLNHPTNRSTHPSPSSSHSPSPHYDPSTSNQRGDLGTHQLSEARKMMLSDNLPLTPGKEAEGGMSFTMLCQLISEGRAEEVPGIQHIPDELNAMPASTSTLPTRLKPWEQPRVSPPGTTAFFTDPPLAPSPPSFDFEGLTEDQIPTSLDQVVSGSKDHRSPAYSPYQNQPPLQDAYFVEPSTPGLSNQYVNAQQGQGQHTQSYDPRQQNNQAEGNGNANHYFGF